LPGRSARDGEMSAGDDIIIEYRGVTKSFDGNLVLAGLDLAVQRGETLTIVGRSGSGKSVMLRALTGLLPVDDGRIYVDGEEITGLEEDELLAVRKKMGMLFQSAALFDSMTVFENVAYPLREHTDYSEERIAQVVKETLKMVELGGVENSLPGELSGGMKKRVGLARAIALRPKIILYDEPTTGLDPITANVINRMIKRLQNLLKITSIVVTHDLQSAFMVTDRIAMLHQGKIISVETPEQFRRAEDPRVKEFLYGGLTQEELRRLGHIL